MAHCMLFCGFIFQLYDLRVLGSARPASRKCPKRLQQAAAIMRELIVLDLATGFSGSKPRAAL